MQQKSIKKKTNRRTLDLRRNENKTRRTREMQHLRKHTMPTKKNKPKQKKNAKSTVYR